MNRVDRFALALTQDHWRRRSWLSRGLWPLSLIYRLVVAGRGRAGRTTALSAPVIVVGNLTVGGSGKTPLVLALARRLETAGFRPGIVARGYGGRETQGPRLVLSDGDPAEFGDEPVLMAARGYPVVVARDRRAGAEMLIARGATVVLSDDGLQNVRLPRDMEIVAVEGGQGFGNGWCLPAGPLREPLTRLAHVDAVVVSGPWPAGLEEAGGRVPAYPSQLRATGFVAVQGGRRRDVATLVGGRLIAVAGIGAPERFFATLGELGVVAQGVAYPDHHRFVAADFSAFTAADAILMTEKDAVKCRAFADHRFWYLEVEAEPVPALFDHVLRQIALWRAPDDVRE